MSKSINFKPDSFPALIFKGRENLLRAFLLVAGRFYATAMPATGKADMRFIGAIKQQNYRDLPVGSNLQKSKALMAICDQEPTPSRQHSAYLLNFIA